MLSVVELTPVTVIKRAVVVMADGKVTVKPVVPSFGNAPKLTTVPSENVRVPLVIWSSKFGLS
jgi:hypothetical protein